MPEAASAAMTPSERTAAAAAAAQMQRTMRGRETAVPQQQGSTRDVAGGTAGAEAAGVFRPWGGKPSPAARKALKPSDWDRMWVWLSPRLSPAWVPGNPPLIR